MIQLQTPKIEIYRTRTFSDKLSDTFNFLRENWRPLLKYFFYIMLPVSIVMAFFVNHFWNGYISLIMMLENIGSGLDFGGLSFALSTVGVIIISLIAYVVLAGLTFCLIRLYDKRPQRLQDLTFDEMKPELMYCMKRGIVLLLTTVLLMVVAMIVVVIPVVLVSMVNQGLGLVVLALLYLLLLAMVMPLLLVTPIYLMEDETGVFAAFAKAFLPHGAESSP